MAQDRIVYKLISKGGGIDGRDPEFLLSEEDLEGLNSDEEAPDAND